MQAMPAVPRCPVCGDSLWGIQDDGSCPGCNAPARARSLSELLETVVGPAIAQSELADLPLLAFAATRAEQQMLAPYFHALKSVSLFGEYGSDHESGVDIRDLGRYAKESFSGAFGILLFDYFPEFDQALGEVYRVLAPGGVFFTLVLSPRVRLDDSPPEVTKRIEPKKGYFDYIPEGGELFSVKVGQDGLCARLPAPAFGPSRFASSTGRPGIRSSGLSASSRGMQRTGSRAASAAAARPVRPSGREEGDHRRRRD